MAKMPSQYMHESALAASPARREWSEVIRYAAFVLNAP